MGRHKAALDALEEAARYSGADWVGGSGVPDGSLILYRRSYIRKVFATPT